MPSTEGPYAAWVSWLAAFGRGEDPPSGHLTRVDQSLGPEMLARLTSHVATAFHDRQRRWSDALVRDQQLLRIDPANAGTAIAVVLHNARALLAPLVAFTAMPLFPTELRENLRTALAQTVRSAQQTLVDSAREAPEELRNAIAANSLLPALTRPPTARPPTGSAPVRRVILS
ncbi:MAG TPA: hypothetical protein VH333_10030 [Pseudonocardiaceae bacterium]|nr:hypothetical protein [Pseudonocardiaceae bacterium]